MGGRMRTFAIAAIITLLAIPASAQGMSGGRGHHKADQKSEEHKKKPDDTAYNSALGKLPDRKYDPWQGLR
jgi:hypothetical protein